MPRQAEIIQKAMEGIPISSYFDYFDVDNMPLLKECLNMDFEDYVETGKRYFDECVWSLAYQELINRQNELTEKFKNCNDNDERTKIMQELSAVSKSLREKRLEDFYVR